MTKRLLPLTLALALAVPVALSNVAFAADHVDATTSNSTIVSKDDVKFLNLANQGGLLEVKSAEFASKRNISGPAADFAKKVSKEHEAINADLTSLASKKGVHLPTALDEDAQKKFDKLAKVEDGKLAKEYIEYEIKAHKAAISEFKDAADDSKDVDVKAFAAKYLPHLQAHLDEAKRIEDAM
jgi:putative membrane protein